MFLFFGWDDGFGGWWAWWYGREQKVGGGDVRASPFRGTASGIKPENSFSALSPLAPTVARGARHSHPSPPEEKAASRKTSRLRRKKTAPDAQKWRIVYVKGGIFLPMILATTDPPRLIALAFAGSKLRFRLRLSLAWSCPRYAISDGGFAASLPYFLFFSIPPGSISPGTIPAHQSPAIKRAVQKNATLQKSGVRYFSA